MYESNLGYCETCGCYHRLHNALCATCRDQKRYLELKDENRELRRKLALAEAMTDHVREELALAIKKIEELNDYDLERHKKMMALKSRADDRERAIMLLCNAEKIVTDVATSPEGRVDLTRGEDAVLVAVAVRGFLREMRQKEKV